MMYKRKNNQMQDSVDEKLLGKKADE